MSSITVLWIFFQSNLNSMYPKWCISLSQLLHSGGCPLKSMKIYKQNIFDLDYKNLRPVLFKVIFCSSISLKISATAFFLLHLFSPASWAVCQPCLGICLQICFHKVCVAKKNITLRRK
uniref:Uncharacterized protein n=1 Tax=Cacopsylla melanoneura TaxID=428564 RepID=A0A8D8SM28_9HEMI